MRPWRMILGPGLVCWLVPFVVAFLAFSFRASARPLFESIMAVAVAATAVILGLRYLKRSGGTRAGRQPMILERREVTGR